MTLYRDDMSYLDLVYGVAVTQEHKVDMEYDSGHRIMRIEESLREAQWFIEKLCETVTLQEKQIDVLYNMLNKLKEYIDIKEERI